MYSVYVVSKRDERDADMVKLTLTMYTAPTTTGPGSFC